MRRLSHTIALAATIGCAVATKAAAAPDLASYVNPFNGTQPGAPDFGTGGGAGNTFPGPVVPFGMIQWGPDTTPSSNNVGGGYAYDDSRIRGFSLRRLTGAGCANEGDVPFMSTTAPVTSSPVNAFSTEFNDSFLPSFSHGDEAATPGYYRVGLNSGTPNRIDAQLTATTRAGIGRFAYPGTPAANILINATGSRAGDSGGSVQIDPAGREVTGSASSGGFCLSPDKYRIFFAARFSRPFTAYGTWTRQLLAPGSTSAQDISLTDPSAMSGYGPTAQTGAYVTFDTTLDRAVEVRVGISFVSADNARRNLDAETAGRDFHSVQASAHRDWNAMLGKIEVKGGSDADRHTFYSMLYHALITPTTFSDVDRRYRGMDDEVHTAAGYTQYADFSGWDVYRSQMPLLGLIAPQQASDFVRSLVADQRESGWLPKWSVANGHTDVMTGDPADPTIASIWALGGRAFDPHAALVAMVKGATQSGKSPNAGYVEREAVDDYQQLGYVPHEKNANVVTGGVGAYARSMPAPGAAAADLAWGSAGTTLEYALDDFAVARLAAVAGDLATCRRFLARSGNWRNVFDASIGYVRPRFANGQFIDPYDPNSNDALSNSGFAEGDGAQYTWMVPHDPAGLFEALGGKRAASARLDSFFQQLNAGFSSPHAFLGNEPNSNAPWLYDWIGQPYKTQDIVRRAILGLFRSSPSGYPGNDDLGQMSAWYVFGALGLYPAVPGTDVLALGSPLFPKATVHLPGGDLSVTAPAAARDRPFVQRLALDGRDYRKPWLRLAAVARGGTLAFDLGKKPNVHWGSESAAAPPSFGPTGATACSREPTSAARARRPRLRVRGLRHGRALLEVSGDSIRRVTFYVGARAVRRVNRPPFRVRVRRPRRGWVLARARVNVRGAPPVTLTAKLRSRKH
jgi:predicted alpha-1,2-mannosidase